MPAKFRGLVQGPANQPPLFRGGASIQASPYSPESTSGNNQPGSGCHSTRYNTKNYEQLSRKTLSVCQQW
ncbi:hypothetical protein TNCV_2962771 [Trichonephila clavipes]|nr:hypothetical protein TNCV_2962771 [Trichonephila clavipes]